MPYKSAKQAAFMHINHPEIAKKWDAEGHRPPKKKRSKAMDGLHKVGKKRKQD